jgi:fructokinase
MTGIRIGIDLGGTKIEGIALGPDGAILDRRRVPTPAGDADATIIAVRDLVLGIETGLGLSGADRAPVGIGTPGSLSPRTGLMRNSNSTCLNGLPLDRLLAAALDRPVRLANDANCFALSEASDGAAAGAATVFGVILGTGVGGGIVIDGKIIAGGNGNSGEWGHNPLPWPRDDERPGAPCYCGRQGCIETFLSGPGMARDHASRTGAPVIDAPTIFARAAAGDEAANSGAALYVERLARALATVINMLDPDAIVLGGGLSNVSRLYDEVPAIWHRWVFSDSVTTRLVPPAHGDSSGVRGAAWLGGAGR